jgi:hypothetical protein
VNDQSRGVQGFKHLLSLAVCALYAKEAAEFASQLRHLFAHNADKVREGHVIFFVFCFSLF